MDMIVRELCLPSNARMGTVAEMLETYKRMWGSQCYETVLIASLLGIGGCCHPRDTVCDAECEYKAFSRMFECVATELCCTNPDGLQGVCRRVSEAVESGMRQKAALRILDKMSRVLGTFMTVEGPLGAMCSRVLLAAYTYVFHFREDDYSCIFGPIINLYSFIVEVLPSAKRLRAFHAGVPTIMDCLPDRRDTWLAAEIVAECAANLAIGRMSGRVQRELLDVLFELPGSGTPAFVSAVHSEITKGLGGMAFNEVCRKELAPWLLTNAWFHSLRCAWVSACVAV
jgi:hypothetical protein